MFTRAEIDFLQREIAMQRVIAAKYSTVHPEVTETCTKKADMFEKIAKKIERLIDAIEA